VIIALPLPTRNVLDLLATDAGVASILTSPSATVNEATEAMFVGGAHDTANNYMVNGVDANNFEYHTLAPGSVPIPNPDSVQEFRTETSLYDATTGFSGGGNIALITRHGTNAYHGSLYEFLRNSALNANDYFFNLVGTPRPFLIQNQFGGSLGGPVPRIQKTFWFFNYEGMRQDNGVIGGITASMAVLPAKRDAASLASAFNLPVSAIDPVAVNILNVPGPFNGYLFPSGTKAPVGELGPFAFSAPVRFSSNQYNARVDHELKLGNVINNLSGIYFLTPGKLTNNAGVDFGFLGEPYFAIYTSQTLSLHDTQILRPSLLNDITVGFTLSYRDGNSASKLTIGDIGMSRFNSSILTAVPDLSFADQAPCCGAIFSGYPAQHNQSFDARDMVSYQHGKHSLRLGFEARTQQFNDRIGADPGSLFFGNFNADFFHGPPSDPLDDLSIRDFLIGAPVTASIGSSLTRFGYRAHDFGIFAQDDFRVTSRLTLNLGLRWDYLGNITEVHDEISNFDPSRLDAQTLEFGGPGLQAAFISPAGYRGGGTPGVSKSTLQGQDLGDFSPRIGFAYDVFGKGKMAVRGGYGIYYMRISGLNPLQASGNYPFSAFGFNEDFFNSPGLLLANPFPTLPLPSQFPQFPSSWPTLLSIAPVTGAPNFNAPYFTSGIAVTELDTHSHAPYTEQYNLAVQYEFLPRWTVEVGYLGTHGVKLRIAQSLNNALLRNANNPGPFGLDTNAIDNTEARVPIVGVASFGLNALTGAGKSLYDGLLVTVSHQFSKGLFFKAAYTFSKSLDNAPIAIGFEPGFGATGNQYLTNLNYGLSSFDVPHRLVVTYLYNLPGPQHGVLKTVFGNWAISGITTYQSGFPGEIDQSNFLGTLSGAAGYGVVLPNCRLTTGLSPDPAAGVVNYLNPACVAVQPALSPGATFGPLSPYEGPGNQTYEISPNSSGGTLIGASTRGAFRSPFQARWDTALTKTFPWRKLGDSGNFQFRAESFKLFNTPIFNAPNNIAGLSNFGQITSTTDTTGRQFQFSLRVNF
jgi:hypothetical protein